MTNNHDLNQSALTLGHLAAQGWTEPEKPQNYDWLWKLIKGERVATYEADDCAPAETKTSDHWYFNLPVEQPKQEPRECSQTNLPFLSRLREWLRSQIFGCHR